MPVDIICSKPIKYFDEPPKRIFYGKRPTLVKNVTPIVLKNNHKGPRFTKRTLTKNNKSNLGNSEYDQYYSDYYQAPEANQLGSINIDSWIYNIGVIGKPPPGIAIKSIEQLSQNKLNLIDNIDKTTLSEIVAQSPRSSFCIDHLSSNNDIKTNDNYCKNRDNNLLKSDNNKRTQNIILDNKKTTRTSDSVLRRKSQRDNSTTSDINRPDSCDSGNFSTNSDMFSLNGYEAFSRERYDFNNLKATDDFVKFKNLVNVIEHHVFHTGSTSKIAMLVTKICPPGMLPIGQRLFRFTCKFCEDQSNIDIIDVHDFNFDKFDKLVSALIGDGNNTPTNALFTCGILGREGWEFLPIYLIAHRIDILFTIPLTSKLRINGIIHMIAAHIYAHHQNTFPIKAPLDRENMLVAKFGKNIVNLALMCIKMFGVFPVADKETTTKFSMKICEDFYYIIPSLSLISINELLSTFNSVPVGEDCLEYANTTKECTHNGMFENNLETATSIKHLPLIQKCSRELLYYFALNRDVFENYLQSPIAHKDLFELQHHSIEKNDQMLFPIISYNHDKNPSATGECIGSNKFLCRNMDGEMVFDYYTMAQEKMSTLEELDTICKNNNLQYNKQIETKTTIAQRQMMPLHSMISMCRPPTNNMLSVPSLLTRTQQRPLTNNWSLGYSETVPVPEQQTWIYQNKPTSQQINFPPNQSWNSTSRPRYSCLNTVDGKLVLDIDNVPKMVAPRKPLPSYQSIKFCVKQKPLLPANETTNMELIDKKLRALDQLYK